MSTVKWEVTKTADGKPHTYTDGVTQKTQVMRVEISKRGLRCRGGKAGIIEVVGTPHAARKIAKLLTKAENVK